MSLGTLIGTGVLNWPSTERVSDRYGIVYLFPSPNEAEPTPLNRVSGHGKLTALVTETRPSYHIGDLFHGLFPNTPEVGERLELGEGTVFFEDTEYGPAVGLRPDDGRDGWWLNPEMLYRAHHQTVKLYFTPDQ